MPQQMATLRAKDGRERVGGYPPATNLFECFMGGTVRKWGVRTINATPNTLPRKKGTLVVKRPAPLSDGQHFTMPRSIGPWWGGERIRTIACDLVPTNRRPELQLMIRAKQSNGPIGQAL